MSTLSVVESVFLAALEKDTPQERSAYLDEACANDANLRRCVQRLLDAHPKAEGFLQAPAPGLPVTADHAPLSEKPGSVIGPYKLLQELGEGGFGVVFMAEQTEQVRRKVALKVIKPGMDSKQVVARFEQERQALAMMDHPNIARVFDGDTTDSGRPYFVMELVKGVPITTFCDENRLSPRERLELFFQACQAIQHAHHKGVIHRDVKPSNVLVTIYDGKPVVKVIDFGIAKAIEQPMTDKTLFTRHGQVIGTLEYMSPEQASLDSLDVDTRSDVYALGVLLYELLTGSTPLDKEKLRSAGFAEMLRLIREEEPPRPSDRLSGSGVTLPALAAYRKTESAKLPGLVRGELDWITLKALDKDRSRRYQSALGMAEDVARYLRDEQVYACPPSWGYRAGKFLRKHKAAFTLTGTAAALLLVGAVVSGWQAWEATLARREAIDERITAQDERDEAHRLRIAAEAAETKEKAARLTTRRAFYAQSMTLIPLAWEADNPGRIGTLLDALRPEPGEEDLRGFEWHYWDRMLHQERRSQAIKHGRVAMSGDGLRVVHYGGLEKVPYLLLKVVDAPTGKVLFSLSFPPGGGMPRAVTLNRDGTRLAFLRTAPGSMPNRKNPRPFENRPRVAVEVWDVNGTGKTPLFQRKPQGDSFADALEFSPDDKHLATLERIESQEKKGDGPNEGKGAGGGWGWQYRATVLNLAKPEAEPIFSAEVENFFFQQVRPNGDGETSETFPWAFSPDSSRLALILKPLPTTKDREQSRSVLQVWDIATGKRRTHLPIEAGTSPMDLLRIEGIAYSPDGKSIAGIGRFLRSSERTGGVLTFLWRGADGDELKEVRKIPLLSRTGDFGELHSEWMGTMRSPGASIVSSRLPHRLAFSPDSQLLAVYRDSVARLFDLGRFKEVRVLKALHPIASLVFSPDGKQVRALVAPGASEGVQQGGIWKEWAVAGPVRDIECPELDTFRPKPKAVTHTSGKGERQITYVANTYGARDKVAEAGVVTVRDRDGKVLHVFEGHLKDDRHVYQATTSASGKTVLSQGYGRGNCLVWEADTGKVLHRFDRSLMPGALHSPDCRFLLVREAEEWNCIDFDGLGERVRIGRATEIHFTHDSKRLVSWQEATNPWGRVVRSRGEVKVWDLESGRQLNAYPKGEAGLALDSDGRGYIAVKKGVGEITLLDAASGDVRCTFRDEIAPGEFHNLLFSRTGNLVASSPSSGLLGRPGLVRVWDATSGTELFRINRTRIDWLAFSPDGKRLAGFTNGAASGTIKSEVKLWDCATGNELLSLDVPHDNNPYYMLSFSPDGHRLLASFHDSRVTYITRTWDVTPRSAAK